MSFFRHEPERPPAINLGRTHEVLAEIHHAGGEDDWWYHGYLWLTETRSVHRRDFDPALTDPRNQRVLWQIRHGWSDEQIAEVIVKEATGRALASREPLSESDRVAARDSALAIARSVRLSSESANEEHSLRIYGLGTASKTEERILVTVDQDLIAEAPQIPYPQTERGARRRQLTIGGFAAFLYGLLLIWTFATLSTAATSVEGLQGVLAQAEISTLLAGAGAAIMAAAVGVYLLTVRRLRVLDIQVQPIWPTKVHEHTEAVFLVNSKKRPASHYLTNLFRLSPESVLALVSEIGNFQSDLISTLQGQAASYRSELDNAQIQLGEERMRKFDREYLGMTVPSATERWNPGAVALAVLTAISVAVVVLLVLFPVGG